MRRVHLRIGGGYARFLTGLNVRSTAITTDSPIRSAEHLQHTPQKTTKLTQLKAFFVPLRHLYSRCVQRIAPSTTMASSAKPVIIIGAGVVGLTLAHGLKKANIPFEIYERDAHIDARPHGWAITLHWVLPFLRQLLDEPTLAAVDDVQVDPEVGRNDKGNFLFLNLETLETKFRIPPNERRRVNREKLRKALLQGVAESVRWGKRLSDVQPLADDDSVRAVFDDGTSADGRMLVGAEGSNSRTRKFLVPDGYRNHPLPVRMVGAAIDISPEEVKPLREIDPLLFQGCHPQTGNFLWVSMLETPETNKSAGTANEHYRIQVITSWLVKDASADEVPPTDVACVAEMKRRAAEFNPVLRNVVNSIPPSAAILTIAPQDWPCQPWDNRGGRVTLVGDAAHAMTMYRGEAGNHGILDAYHLYMAIREIYTGEKTMQVAVDEYEAEMTERSAAAVLLSRQACLDAHDFHGLNENSAVLKKRAIRMPS
ncbi:Tetracycline resistance protein from transposon [Tolypocladium capitatum]|uniref:Tetracycline resistance protein from transposon n=1 Tax=Tolypocladium capitatum TaxID=45235 RepID=A0A2K3QNX1_9HYPO|nr:Tetracycline resistance protein from transposon [Tolypocladium capitatum]